MSGEFSSIRYNVPTWGFLIDVLVRKFVYGPGVDEPMCMHRTIAGGGVVGYCPPKAIKGFEKKIYM
jgi:hypothetical protein